MQFISIGMITKEITNFMYTAIFLEGKKIVSKRPENISSVHHITYINNSTINTNRNQGER